ncbi:MAG: hypothetical protein HYZ53_08890 [Planctomycetes bacterium]|nr:hypothetical protein [Planctomycetota bacterium]
MAKRPKPERLAEFCRRVQAGNAAAMFEEAYDLLCRTMDAVEDELTDIPNRPAHWKSDGPMYPPQRDSLTTLPGGRVMRLRSLRHYTFIGDNGAIEIVGASDGKILLSKRGRDGRRVGDL